MSSRSMAQGVLQSAFAASPDPSNILASVKDLANQLKMTEMHLANSKALGAADRKRCLEVYAQVTAVIGEAIIALERCKRRNAASRPR